MLLIGDGVTVEEDTILNVGGKCTIGDETYISVRGLIGCEELVEIGRRVAIGPNVSIIDTNKRYTNVELPIIRQGKSSKPISIGDDCWIGANAVILAGTELGAHTVVAAASVVNAKFPPNVVLAGSPARIIKYLDSNSTK